MEEEAIRLMNSAGDIELGKDLASVAEKKQPAASKPKVQKEKPPPRSKKEKKDKKKKDKKDKKKKKKKDKAGSGSDVGSFDDIVAPDENATPVPVTSPVLEGVPQPTASPQEEDLFGDGGADSDDGGKK